MSTLEKSLEKEDLELLLYTSMGVCVLGIAVFAALGWRLSRPRKITVPRLSAADRAIIEDPVKQDGLALHFKVPMHRWCVTREDLQQFERLVKNAVHDGRIVPTDRDAFDPEDHVIGPCVHTVNSQFIMPVTKAAGGPSWALMKHPEGLPCDLFVTHGWAEGIYEFIGKVLNSWPAGAHCAYCCMLSNPQNLDISELCHTPKDSPFAQALNNAKFMLVVPNRTGSIYTRVWCAYEAFLGYSGHKKISTASTKGTRFWLKTIQAYFAFIAGAGGGLVLSAGFELAGWGGADSIKIYSVGVLLLFALMFVSLKRRYHGTKRLAAVRFGLLWHLASYFATVFVTVPLGQSGTMVNFVLLCLVPFYAPWAIQADLVIAGQSIQESRQLQHGFTGKLRDAQCSVAADGERIREELANSGSEAAVDEAVKVLIAMGTFSPRLRATVERTGVLGNMNRLNKAAFVAVITLWVLIPLEHFTYHYCSIGWLSWLAWALLLVWCVTYLFLPRDCKAFAVGALLASVPTWTAGAVDLILGTVQEGNCIMEWGLACFSGPTIVLLTLLGPAYTAQLPLVGPPLVRLLTCSRRRRPPTSTSENDKEEEGPEEL